MPGSRRIIDWIWCVRGTLPLPPEQTSDDAFERLAPLFHEKGTTYDRNADKLTFRKKAQPAQDKMSVFDAGILQITRGVNGAVLRYRMSSRALLFCFLAPLLFLGFAQLTITVGEYEKAKAEASEKTKKPEKKKDPVLTQNPIDKALGAPAPEKPNKDKPEEKSDDYSPTPAYVFAGIFAALYVIGRILEDRMVRELFRKSLFGPTSDRKPSRWRRFLGWLQQSDRRMIASRVESSGIMDLTTSKRYY